MAALMVYGQYHQQIEAAAAQEIAAGVGNVFNGGVASIFCSFPAVDPPFPMTQGRGYLVLIEFFVDSYIVSSTRDQNRMR